MKVRSAFFVVPCYNEAQRLNPETWIAFASRNPDMGFVFVNDGSTDDTKSVLDQLCLELPAAMSSIDLPTNRGKAAAVRAGILEAMALGPSYVGFLDADLATPLCELDRLVQVLEQVPEIEIVMGSRMHLSGHQIRRPPHRRLLGQLFSFLTKVLLRFPFHDTQCGAKMFRVTDRIRDIFQRPFASKWIFDVEILLRYSSLAGRDRLTAGVYELPLDHWQEIKGSKLGLKSMFGIVFDLFRIWRFKNRPFDATRSNETPPLQELENVDSRSDLLR